MPPARYRLTIPGGQTIARGDIVTIAAQAGALTARNPHWRPYVHDRRHEHVVARVTRHPDSNFEVTAYKTYEWDKPADRRPDWADQLAQILNTHSQENP